MDDKKKITLYVEIEIGEFAILHIADNHDHSCNYGDSNYNNGMTSQSIGECVKDFLKDYHGMK